MKTTVKTSFPVSAGEIKKTPLRLFYFPALFHIIEARGSLFQIDHDIFRLAVMFQHDLVSFAADAGLLVSAEGSACGNRIVRIDPDTARLYTAADLHGRIQAACENAATQTVDAVVRQFDNFINRLELLHHNDRPEDFFLAYACRICLQK